MEHTQSFTLSTNCNSFPMASRLSYEEIQKKDWKRSEELYRSKLMYVLLTGIGSESEWDLE